jgi:hypothetical protein
MKTKGKPVYEKSYYIISEDDAYEIETMVSTFVCAFWEVLEKRNLNYRDNPVARKALYELFEKHIGKLC